MCKIKKELRDKIMCDIVLKYRENQKRDIKSERVNIFSIWNKYNIPYSDFIDIILSLEAQGYLHYEKAEKCKTKINRNGELIPQEFVILEPSGKSFPEKLSDKMEEEIKTNLKRPLQVQVLTILITLLLSSASIGLLLQIIKWFLSLFHF